MAKLTVGLPKGEANGLSALDRELTLAVRWGHPERKPPRDLRDRWDIR